MTIAFGHCEPSSIFFTTVTESHAITAELIWRSCARCKASQHASASAQDGSMTPSLTIAELPWYTPASFLKITAAAHFRRDGQIAPSTLPFIQPTGGGVQ